MTKRGVIFDAIEEERDYQDGLHDNTGLDDGKWLAVLLEEVGEVAKALLEGDDLGMNAELVQVAAVAVAWLETRVTEDNDALVRDQVLSNGGTC